MLSFAADENFNIHIINGVLRRLPAAEIMRIQDANLEGADDPTVLEWAASEGRILLTHDVNTLSGARTNESKKAFRCLACLRSL